MDIALQLFLTFFSLLGVGVSLVGLPGIILITLSLFMLGIAENFQNIPPSVYIIFVVLAILSSFIDNLMIVLGAKKFGSSKFGMIGAFFGGIFGFFLFPPIGILIGPFIGAVIPELIMTRDVEKSFKIGMGTLFGYLANVFVRFVLALALFVWFMFILW